MEWGGDEVGITAQGIRDDCGVEYTACRDQLRSEESFVLPDRKEEDVSEIVCLHNVSISEIHIQDLLIPYLPILQSLPSFFI